MSTETMSGQQDNVPVPEEITALQIAQGLETIYNEFTQSIRAMGGVINGKKTKSPFVQSALHWIAGSHIKTETDVLCDKFLEDVQKQLQTLDYALEGLPQEQAQEALSAAAEILTQPLPEKSNGTSSLMKRAMIGQVLPLLPRLSRDKLIQIRDKMEAAYKKSQRLPVEQEVLKEIGRLLK